MFESQTESFVKLFISIILVAVIKIHNNAVTNLSKRECAMLLLLSVLWQETSQLLI